MNLVDNKETTKSRELQKILIMLNIIIYTF